MPPLKWVCLHFEIVLLHILIMPPLLVERKFQQSWKIGKCPQVKKVYKVFVGRAFPASYYAYLCVLCSQPPPCDRLTGRLKAEITGMYASAIMEPIASA
jgi:hypothetical protein